MTFVEVGYFGDNTSLNLWDPTSSKVIFPLIIGRFKAAALSAWKAARTAWADEPLVRLPPARPETYRRAAPAILCGAVATALLYSLYRSRTKRRRQFREAYPRLAEATTALPTQAVEEDFYVRAASPEDVCSDLVLPSDLLQQADRLDSDWINRVESNFDVDIRITTTETAHAVLCFVGSSRNIDRAMRYLKSFFRELIGEGASRHTTVSSVELTVTAEKEPLPSLSVDQFHPADVRGRTPVSGSVAGLGDVVRL
ncbi:hypothetical protein RvY_18776 [Ramazzottius varieornatus]|uniref:Uncharacterized protein n=1 Tax=Ramazzottius varieornatus TaxID=947166 RepID=A0A1D1WBQ6_RAMVA|nr:hypothetical protein RvY_18776 [Ramazzottius varieornatus]